MFLFVEVKREVDVYNEDDLRIKEQAILDLGSLLAKNGRAAGNPFAFGNPNKWFA
jgi:hypothetical protein